MTSTIDTTDLSHRRRDFFGGHFDQRGHCIWLGHVDRMTARDFDDGCARALGHKALGLSLIHI